MEKPLVCLLVSITAVAAAAEEAQLTIRVKVRATQSGTPANFSGVGEFQIYRGPAKFDGGSCPEPSDHVGKLVCTLKCSSSDTVVKTLRLVPPGKSYRVRGYVAPAAEEVKLNKCRLQPKSEWTFVYVDASIALSDLLYQQPELRKIAAVNANGVPKFFTTNDAIDEMQTFGETSKGQQVLFKFQGIASAASESPSVRLETSDREATDALPGLIGSIYLKELVKKNVSLEAANKIRIAPEKGIYFRNLEVVEKELDATPGRSPQQNLLLNNVQDWKVVPASASTDSLFGVLAGTSG